jgi:hypothetical protein
MENVHGMSGSKRRGRGNPQRPDLPVEISTICHFQEFRPENMLLDEPLDGAEKSRSKGTGPSTLGVGPDHPRLGITHASVAPVRDVFQTCAVAPLAGFAAAARFLALMSAAKVTE